MLKVTHMFFRLMQILFHFQLRRKQTFFAIAFY